MPSTSQARAVGEGQVNPQLPDALEREAKKVIVGLQLPKGPAKKPNPVQRHVPFSDEAAARTNSKALSNTINKDGHYRGPTICTSCLGAISQWNVKFKTGRGTNDSNEYISCITHKSYGNGGEQCGRCVGLGKGPSCYDVPVALYSDAKELVKGIPRYNQLLLTHKESVGSAWPQADQDFMLGMAGRAQLFKRALDAHTSKHGQTVSNTPRKKRRLDDGLPSDSKLSAIASTSTDTRTDVQKVQMSVGTVNSSVARLTKEVADLKRMALISRARQQWLCDAVAQMAEHLEVKRAADSLDADDPDAPMVPVINVVPFDVNDVDLELEDREGLPDSEEDED